MTRIKILAITFLMVSEVAFAQTFRVGAARVNVTPEEGTALPMSGYAGRESGFSGIHDSLYYRIVVLDDGRTTAALVVGESIGIPEAWWETLSGRIEKEAGIPRGHVIIAGTHTHGAPQPLPRDDQPHERLQSHAASVADRVVAGVRHAKEGLRPARMGVGRGRANVNVNRVARTADGAFWLGQNPDGPSDKTVHVARFDDLNGKPIAILVNYAVHGTVGGQGNLMITGDLPGATSRFVEEHFGGDVVAPWTSGAAGDQNPIYAVVDNLDSGRIRPLAVLGKILGEEAVRVADGIATATPDNGIRAAQQVVRVPGKKQNDYNPSGTYSYEDADSVSIRLTAIAVDDLALGGVSGEVLTRIGERFKNESPFPETVMITHANGSSGYLPSDEDYRTPGYEIMVSRVKPGTEGAIVDGLLELLDSKTAPRP